MKSLKLFGFLAAGAAMVLGLPGAAIAAKAKYAEIAVENGGSVTGKVSFEGALPASAIENILITKNPEICGDGEREVVWIDVKDGALRGTLRLRRSRVTWSWLLSAHSEYRPWNSLTPPLPSKTSNCAHVASSSARSCVTRIRVPSYSDRASSRRSADGMSR